MSGKEDKIYADASQPATFIDDDETIDCPTLDDAVVALDNLPEPRKSAAMGRTSDLRLIGCAAFGFYF